MLTVAERIISRLVLHFVSTRAEREYGGVTKQLNQSLILRMLCISSAKIRILSLSSKNQGFPSKFNYLGKNDF